MIIAEIGINHLGSHYRARRMIIGLLNTKIDGITFQIPTREFAYQFEIRTKLLKNSFYREMIKLVKESNKKIGFAVSDLKMITVLDKYGCDFWKVLSRDFYDKKIINELKKTNKTTYISAGFSSMQEIKKMRKYFGKKAKFVHTCLSHKLEDVNLLAIKSMKNFIGKNNVAFGLHSTNLDVLYWSQFYNPFSTFFYVKTNENTLFPDNKHAIRIEKIDLIIKNINSIQKVIGKGLKKKVLMNNKFEVIGKKNDTSSN